MYRRQKWRHGAALFEKKRRFALFFGVRIFLGGVFCKAAQNKWWFVQKTCKTPGEMLAKRARRVVKCKKIQKEVSQMASGEWAFTDPATASLRVPVMVNEDGEIAGSGDTAVGEKSITFSSTAASASYDDLAYGGGEGSTTGILTTFITYLLGASFNEVGVTRTFVQTIDAVPEPPEP